MRSRSAVRLLSAPPLLLAIVLASSCTGPRLHIDNPERHRVFVDGRLTAAESLKFRYYGVTRWDAIPADRDGEPDWYRRPASREVAIAPPAPPFLFPLDLPIELATGLLGSTGLLGGTGDTTITIDVPHTDAQARNESELGNAERAAITERALAARASR
ncbi:MAG: hypothetical protein JNL12_21430 [Planctomycetes bacterium]|nr:hypothetical protein [Planctomycetota bacterium]